jgi:uncharacterized protein YjlB
MQQTQVETLYFDDDGHIPNNEALPLLRYPGVLPPDQHSADRVKALFADNQWGGAWVDGVFSYHHYHSTAHEAMGVVSGAATIQFGGEHGKLVQVQAGDIVVIPAGVGHCKQGSSADFRVVGVYPHGQDWDLCTGKPEERPQVLENIRQVPPPQTDPVYGNQGPLLDTWDAQS